MFIYIQYLTFILAAVLNKPICLRNTLLKIGFIEIVKQNVRNQYRNRLHDSKAWRLLSYVCINLENNQVFGWNSY